MGRQSNGGMVSGPDLARVLNMFPGSTLVSADEISRGKMLPTDPPLSKRQAMTTTPDPTRDPAADAPEATRAASQPSERARLNRAEAVKVIEELISASSELWLSVEPMYEHMIADDPKRANRKGWQRIRAALDAAEHLVFVDADLAAKRGRRNPLSDPAEDRVQNPSSPTDTQKAAALTALPTSGSSRMAVLDVLAYAQPDATDEEIADVTLLSLNTVRPRRGELVTGGWVEDSGTRRDTSSGNPSTVWRLTAEARERLGRA